MIIKDFWSIIDESYKKSNGIQEKQVELLREALTDTTSDIIKRYCVHMMKLLKKSSTEEIWAAYFMMNGGYEEWGFEDFRYWLMAHGKEFWEATLKDPINFLKDNVSIEVGENPDVTFYEFWGVFKTIYEQKSNAELNNSLEWARVYEEVIKAEFELEKVMRPLTQKHELKVKYPKMYEKFYQQYYYLLKKYQEQKKASENE